MPVDAGFDLRWKKHPAPQATTANVFWQKTGWRPGDLNGKSVLDAGCGCGRFSVIAAESGATVFGIDGSEAAVAAARNNVAGNFQVGDLLTSKLPEVDMAFSLGVLHHTADPRKAFANVASCVRPGGQFAVWLYTKNAPDVAPFIEFLHAITKACPAEQLYAACEKYAVKLRNMNAGFFGPLQQVVRVSNSPDDEECISDTYDWHCPQYRSTHTVAEVASWFREEGFAVDWVGSFPVSVRGIRNA